MEGQAQDLHMVTEDLVVAQHEGDLAAQLTGLMAPEQVQQTVFLLAAPEGDSRHHIRPLVHEGRQPGHDAPLVWAGDEDGGGVRHGPNTNGQ